MDEIGFEAYLANQELAEATRKLRTYALKRIEKLQGVDLDAEYKKDGLIGLSSLLKYSTSDARAGKPNATKLDIEPDKLRTHLSWYRSHLTSYQRFKAGGSSVLDVGSSEVDASEELIEESVGRTFALERDMQLALRAHLDQLEPGLQAIDDGRERRVEAGLIDILAKDAAGVTTVIELKADISRPQAVAQILAYMACVSAEGVAVKGILIAADHDPRVKLAARAVPNLQLKNYSYRFHFE